MASKICQHCNKRKRLTSFNTTRARKGKKKGTRVYCKACQKVYQTKYEKDNHQALKEKRRKHRCSSPYSKFKQLQMGAEDRNIEVKLTIEDYKKLIETRTCYYCDHSFSEEQGGNLNRINSSKPYSKTNVRPCCKICNSIMNNYSVKQLSIRVFKIVKRMKNDCKN